MCPLFQGKIKRWLVLLPLAHPLACPYPPHTLRMADTHKHSAPPKNCYREFYYDQETASAVSYHLHSQFIAQH